jgi:hypothetical protein
MLRRRLPRDMDGSDALKWTAIYRGTAWLCAALGGAIAGVPLYLYGTTGVGLDLWLDKLGNQPALLVPVVVGVVVWQVGTTAAHYKTMVEAVDAELADRFDPELVKSDILSVLDERLAEMQTQLEGTRRAVEGSDPGPPRDGTDRRDR